jgi:ankyrin repeat protein
MKNKPRLSFSLLFFLFLLYAHCNCAKHSPSDDGKKKLNNSEGRSASSASTQSPSPVGSSSESATTSEESVESEEDEEEAIDPSTLIHLDMIEKAQQAGKDYEPLAHVLSDLQKNTPGPNGKKYDINTPNEKGQTPLHAAISLGDEEILRALLTLNADVNKKIDYPTDPSQHGMAPLHLAIAQGKENIVKILVGTKGIDLNTQNLMGDTPFHMALTAGIANGSFTLLQHLANQDGTDFNIRNNEGNTPAHIIGAMSNGGPILQALKSAGINTDKFDPLIVNKKGELPFTKVWNPTGSGAKK